MAEITLENLTKVYPDGTEAVTGLDLEVGDGEFVVFVGPSGCGKTTALRMIAGLETITSGTVKIDRDVVNDLPPKDRDIAMVFQNYALYPHMNASDNMGFALKMRGVPRREIESRVREAAVVLGLTDALKKKPRTLSGGQRQRVAMGRAIVRQPQAFLMDEPLSNLDAKLRVEMRAEIARLQRDLERDDGVRHPRPDRGDDDGRPRRGHERWSPTAGRRPAAALRASSQPVRGRIHRVTGDERRAGGPRPLERRPLGALRRPPPTAGPVHAGAAPRSFPLREPSGHPGNTTGGHGGRRPPRGDGRGQRHVDRVRHP